METIRFSSAIKRPHIQRQVWELTDDQILQCVRESSNRFDPFIINDSEIGGPRAANNFSCMCSVHAAIWCEVTGDS